MKPVLFNTEMVKAIQEGKKTVTRRVVKQLIGASIPADTQFWVSQHSGLIYWGGIDQQLMIDGKPVMEPYHPGGILYVRETFFQHAGEYVYRASAALPGLWDGMWRPSIHMPKEAARIFLRVTDVRVERLQDSFSERGSTIFSLQNEGVDIGDHCRQCIENYGYPCCNDLDPELEIDDDTGEDENGGSECGMLDEVRYKFSRLWDNTIKPADRPLCGYGANPWVWVIGFEKISRKQAKGV